MPRTSGLQAPVMELTGHSGEVFCARFDPNGNYIASGSMDRTICMFYIFSRGHVRLLTVDSALENVWQLRKLREVDWP